MVNKSLKNHDFYDIEDLYEIVGNPVSVRCVCVRPVVSVCVRGSAAPRQSLTEAEPASLDGYASEGGHLKTPTGRADGSAG